MVFRSPIWNAVLYAGICSMVGAVPASPDGSVKIALSAASVIDGFCAPMGGGFETAVPCEDHLLRSPSP